MSKTTTSSKTYGGIASFIKGIIISFIITFSLIIIFAFAIKWMNLSDEIISPINLIIKGISIAIGSLLFTRKTTKGIIKGSLFGILYTVIAFVIFSLLAGSISLNIGLILDLLFGIMIGGIMGIIGVNSKK